jgi:hypothetical protein
LDRWIILVLGVGGAEFTCHRRRDDGSEHEHSSSNGLQDLMSR